MALLFWIQRLQPQRYCQLREHPVRRESNNLPFPLPFVPVPKKVWGGTQTNRCCGWCIGIHVYHHTDMTHSCSTYFTLSNHGVVSANDNEDITKLVPEQSINSPPPVFISNGLRIHIQKLTIARLSPPAVSLYLRVYFAAEPRITTDAVPISLFVWSQPRKVLHWQSKLLGWNICNFFSFCFAFFSNVLFFLPPIFRFTPDSKHLNKLTLFCRPLGRWGPICYIFYYVKLLTKHPCPHNCPLVPTNQPPICESLRSALFIVNQVRVGLKKNLAG